MWRCIVSSFLCVDNPNFSHTHYNHFAAFISFYVLFNRPWPHVYMFLSKSTRLKLMILIETKISHKMTNPTDVSHANLVMWRTTAIICPLSCDENTNKRKFSWRDDCLKFASDCIAFRQLNEAGARRFIILRDDNADYCPNSIRNAATWPELFTSSLSEKEIMDVFKRAVWPSMTGPCTVRPTLFFKFLFHVE